MLVQCKTLDQARLEKTKLDKAFARLSKRGDDKIRAFVQKIRDGIAKASNTKPSAEQAVDASKGSKPLPSATKPVDAVAGVKRAREQDSAQPQPTKKVASTVPTKATSNSTSSRPATSATNKQSAVLAKSSSAVKSEVKSGPGSTAASTVPKVKVVTTKPSSYLIALQSASKKPGTSIAAQKAVQSTETKQAISDTKNVAASAPAPKAFSFADIMANLDKPKEVESTKKTTDDRPPETEEERSKRLRKEERRKLRVRFKPDMSLVEVRLFHHHPEEEIGHDDNMIRDVADVKNEGRMLKLHKELEVDDDDDGATDDLVAFQAPSLIDFSSMNISPEDLDRTIETRGGKAQIKSSERDVQKQRELNNLLVFYNSTSDIPNTPKEPPDPFSGPPSVEHRFGEPREDIKARSAKFFSQHAQPPPHSMIPSANPTPAPDINSILSMLSGRPQQPQAPPVPAPVPQAQPTGLEAIFAQFAGSQSHAPVNQPTQAPLIDQSIQNALNIFNQQQAQQQQQQQQQQQAAFNPPPAVPQTTPDIGALLAQLNNQQIGQQNSQPQGYNYSNQYGTEIERKRHYDGEQRPFDQYNDPKRSKPSTAKKVSPVLLRCTLSQ